jgi:hypothetical protein
MSTRRLVQIFCKGINRKGRECGAHLGYLELDRPHVHGAYCRQRHEDGKARLVEFEVDANSAVRMKVLPPDERIEFVETAVILTE